MAGYFPGSPQNKCRVNRLDRAEYVETCRLRTGTDIENSCNGACLRGLVWGGGRSGIEIRITCCGFEDHLSAVTEVSILLEYGFAHYIVGSPKF
jgi:hypothetical protein